VTIKQSFVVVAIGCLAVVSGGSAFAEGPWVGTYSMRLPDEIAQQIADGGGALPTLDITLNVDGTFVSAGIEGDREWSGEGSYSVEGTTVTISEKERDGKPVNAEPMVFDAETRFTVLNGASGGTVLTFVREN